MYSVEVWLSTDYAALYPRRQNTSWPPVGEPQIPLSVTLSSTQSGTRCRQNYVSARSGSGWSGWGIWSEGFQQLWQRRFFKVSQKEGPDWDDWNCREWSTEAEHKRWWQKKRHLLWRRMKFWGCHKDKEWQSSLVRGYHIHPFAHICGLHQKRLRRFNFYSYESRKNYVMKSFIIFIARCE
jgi:hypothetical protein